jgi:hypothetical protein
MRPPLVAADTQEDEMDRTRTRAVTAAALALAGVLALGAPASAREVQREGDCVGPADWRLEVENEVGGLQVDLRIRGPENRSWDVRIKQNGNRFFHDTRNTGPDGEFRIRRQRPNTAGTDDIFFRALGPGDQVCQGRILF